VRADQAVGAAASGETGPELSASTSAYSQARSRLPLEVAENVSDMIFESLLVKPTVLPGLQQALFLLGGSTLLLAHSEDLAAAYPPPRNQHGASHWSVVRVSANAARDESIAVAVQTQAAPFSSQNNLAATMLVSETKSLYPWQKREKGINATKKKQLSGIGRFACSTNQLTISSSGRGLADEHPSSPPV
jgi:hypothetical protein